MGTCFHEICHCLSMSLYCIYLQKLSEIRLLSLHFVLDDLFFSLNMIIEMKYCIEFDYELAIKSNIS